MSKVILSIAAFAALALVAIAPQAARADIICDDDGCAPAIVMSDPILLGDDDCGCED